uniref:ADF-H domain-containing protein n=1 Tax=Rhizochromulina marina TaxID=1034831 RepID=A0A7S2RWF3_9STRA
MMEVAVDSGVGAAWQDVIDDKTETAWCTAGYEGKRIVPKNSGSGGRTECLASIQSDKEIIFGGFRLLAVDDRGSTVSSRPKFVFFMFRAPGASAMAKAKAGRHLGQLQQCFHGFHIDFQIDELYELSEAEIVRKLRAAGGAHQPTGYDFGHGDVGEGAEEAAPAPAPVANPADAAPASAKAPPMPAAAASASAPPAAAAASAPPPPPAAPAVAAASPALSAVTEATAALSVAGGETCEAGQVLVLISGMPSTSIIEGNQTSTRQIFTGKGITAVRYIDGVSPENKEERNSLFTLSGKRGVYPQVFIKDPVGTIKFVADFEELQSLNDTDTLPADVLDANPQIPSFSRVFKGFMKKKE